MVLRLKFVQGNKQVQQVRVLAPVLDQVLDLFEIKPDYDLNIMKPGQDLFDLTGNVLLGIKQILIQEM